MADFFRRLRIAVAILVGFFCGRYAAQAAENHASEVFSAAFLGGVLVTQGLLKVLSTLTGKRRRVSETV